MTCADIDVARLMLALQAVVLVIGHPFNFHFNLFDFRVRHLVIN
jgi:hypothetical protein